VAANRLRKAFGRTPALVQLGKVEDHQTHVSRFCSEQSSLTLRPLSFARDTEALRRGDNFGERPVTARSADSPVSLESRKAPP